MASWRLAGPRSSKTLHSCYWNRRLGMVSIGFSTWYLITCRSIPICCQSVFHLLAIAVSVVQNITYVVDGQLIILAAWIPKKQRSSAGHYPLVNQHRPWKSPIFNGFTSLPTPIYLPGSMLIYQRVYPIISPLYPIKSQFFPVKLPWFVGRSTCANTPGYLLASLMKRREDASQERMEFFFWEKNGVGKKLGRVAHAKSTEKNHHNFPFWNMFWGRV